MAKYRDASGEDVTNLIVIHNGVERYLLNKRLLTNQNAWCNLEKIKAIHVTKLDIYDAIEDTSDPVELNALGQDLQLCEFELQKLWNFEENAAYHRFWETPKCTCPVLDNQDMYPYRSIINLACPLHGGFPPKK